MKWFKCFIAGENFPGDLINEAELIGFYTTRFVGANTAEEAEMTALTRLKREKSLQLPEGVNPPENAKIYFEKIEEVPRNEVPEVEAGFTFYVMGT